MQGGVYFKFLSLNFFMIKIHLCKILVLQFCVKFLFHFVFSLNLKALCNIKYRDITKNFKGEILNILAMCFQQY